VKISDFACVPVLFHGKHPLFRQAGPVHRLLSIKAFRQRGRLCDLTVAGAFQSGIVAVEGRKNRPKNGAFLPETSAFGTKIACFLQFFHAFHNLCGHERGLGS
jgi:hypothetical protein